MPRATTDGVRELKGDATEDQGGPGSGVGDQPPEPPLRPDPYPEFVYPQGQPTPASPASRPTTTWGLPVGDASTIPPSEAGPPPPPRRRALLVAVALVVLGSLIAVVIVATGGGGKPAANGSPTPSATPAVVEPAGLTSNVNVLAVTLTWSEPGGGAAVVQYNVYRDGALLASPGLTTYTDTSAVPGTTYSYDVEAVGPTGTSARASIQVAVPVPSLALARLQGDFNVKAKTLTHSGYSSYPASFTLGYHFDPKCDTGPCNVVWTDLSEKRFKATFTEKGASYTGSDTGDFGAVCGSTAHDSLLTFSIRVVKAKPIDGNWRASKLVGTVTQYDAPQLGCVTGRATISITLTLIS